MMNNCEYLLVVVDISLSLNIHQSIVIQFMVLKVLQLFVEDCQVVIETLLPISGVDCLSRVD